MFVLAIFLFFIVAAAFGWVADSRDGADWMPTWDGVRQSRRGT
jgi:hypothetical protein